MPVFGFVLTLDGSASASDALEQLASEPGVTLGETRGGRLPIVLELERAERHEERVASWLELPGIAHVDYAFADFEDLVGDGTNGGAE
jgi:hypothetical protein